MGQVFQRRHQPGTDQVFLWVTDSVSGDVLAWRLASEAEVLPITAVAIDAERTGEDVDFVDLISELLPED